MEFVFSTFDLYLFCDFFYWSHSCYIKMAASPSVVDEHTVLNPSLDGLLRRLHHLWKQNPR